ncbi:MAG: ATP-binding protein [Chloroflexi bacterium]|nr:ATP-binding protein [Chloroflexota bacterium]
MRELSLHVLDVMENAVEAGATRIEVRIDEDLGADRLVIEVADNGRGMSKEMTQRALDPFFTTRETRHVGLGLPLFAAAAQRCDGDLTIESEPGRGTRVRATFRHSHLDRAPLGDMPSALMAILLSGRPVDVAYTHRVGEAEFSFDSADVRRELGDIPLTHPAVRQWLWQTLREGEESLHAHRSQQS